MTSLTPDDQPAWTVIRVSAQWANVRRVLESRLRLRVAEGRLLWLLRDGEPRTLRQIAQELDLEQSTVNRQVHSALESGVIVRFRREGSATYLVDISDEGRERFRADLAQQLDVHDRALAAIPEGDREAFLKHLTAFVAALGEGASRDE